MTKTKAINRIIIKSKKGSATYPAKLEKKK